VTGSETPAVWAARIRAAIGTAPTHCVCGNPVHDGRKACPACLAAEARIRWCPRCGQPVDQPDRYMHPDCASAAARAVAALIASGRVRVADLLPKPRPGGGHLAATQRAQGLDPQPAREPTRAERRAERDAREADARARMYRQEDPR
jgi:hypothetical protein